MQFPQHIVLDVRGLVNVQIYCHNGYCNGFKWNSCQRLCNSVPIVHTFSTWNAENEKASFYDAPMQFWLFLCFQCTFLKSFLILCIASSVERSFMKRHMKKVTMLAKRAWRAFGHEANERHHRGSPCRRALEDAALSTVLILSSRFHLDLRQLKFSFSLHFFFPTIYKHIFFL